MNKHLGEWNGARLSSLEPTLPCHPEKVGTVADRMAAERVGPTAYGTVPTSRQLASNVFQ
ncbi:hypothetical protein [Paraburkholderia nemoris]|uniref:hypothetical protein n=1 Tax=Paraburkholderia nemoris TaxID=2793076 RepID=UPI00190C3F8E|nr:MULTISPECIES: hypothetical protein [Paraburkholderia]MBK3816176.1 hypothetical protein [Paraburkholderia aspalathi]